jgi:hypothetical protein
MSYWYKFTLSIRFSVRFLKQGALIVELGEVCGSEGDECEEYCHT